MGTSCSSDSYPNDEFVSANPTVFDNPDPLASNIDCSSTCGNATNSTNWADGVYSYYDTRCPSFGAIYTAGCTPPYANMCRECFTRSAFIAAAFTSQGVYGNTSSTADNKAAPASKPICPPCVCNAWGLDSLECASETLPGSTSCTKLAILHPRTGTDVGVSYCSNGNRTSTSSHTSGASRTLDEAIAHKERQPQGEQLKKHRRRPPVS